MGRERVRAERGDARWPDPLPSPSPASGRGEQGMASPACGRGDSNPRRHVMFGYYLDLAWRSLKRTPVLTGLMVLAIGLGIGASMTMLTVLHVMTDDPLPGRSAQLYTPHLDPLPLDYKQHGDSPDANDNLTWPDAMALLKAHRATRQAAMAGGSLLVR